MARYPGRVTCFGPPLDNDYNKYAEQVCKKSAMIAEAQVLHRKTDQGQAQSKSRPNDQGIQLEC